MRARPRVIRVADRPADSPRQGEPALIRHEHRLGGERERAEVRGRAGVADVDADDPGHACGLAHRELVAEEAAPVVEQEHHRPAGADGIHHRAQQVDHFRQWAGGARLAALEARPGEAHAAKALLERGDLPVPEAIGVGPAVQHHDRRRAFAVDEHVDAADPQGCIHRSPPRQQSHRRRLSLPVSSLRAARGAIDPHGALGPSAARVPTNHVLAGLRHAEPARRNGRP